ncbi:MAG: hypothetical protein JW738_06185 [Actinobacteria bacterium]|nr:hypothetical protein [Actinomycetota bacterium]
MKKFLVVFFATALLGSFLLLSGCGNKNSSDTQTNETIDVVDVNEPVSEGIYGEYEKKNGDGSISLYNDGSFTMGSGVEGDFDLMDNKSLELTYDNGEKETWSIMIADGKVVAIADSDGEQYDKK